MIRPLACSAGALALAIAALIAASGTTSAQQSIAVGDIFFCDASFSNGVCTTTVTAGDTVSWDFGGAGIAHTATACGADCDAPTASPLWDSGVVQGGGTFSFTFTEPGTYLYRCNVHPAQMRGQIVVEAAPEPTVTEPVDDGPSPTDGAPAPVATAPPVVPPVTGFGPDEGSSPNGLLFALIGAGVAFVMVGGAGYRRARR